MVFALALLVAPSGACSRGDGESIVLDGSPRHPDTEGVVEHVDFSSLTLDDGSKFAIDRDVQSFSTYTLEPLALLGRAGQYVQLGLDGERVEWIASVGSVVRGASPSVFYTGTLLRTEGDRLIFRDGTVLRGDVADASALEGTFVVAEIDPEERIVRTLSPG